MMNSPDRQMIGQAMTCMMTRFGIACTAACAQSQCIIVVAAVVVLLVGLSLAVHSQILEPSIILFYKEMK